MGFFNNRERMKEVRDDARSRMTDKGVAEMRIELGEFRSESGQSLQEIADSLEAATAKAKDALAEAEQHMADQRQQVNDIIVSLRSLLVATGAITATQDRMEAATAVVAEDLQASQGSS